MSYFHQQGSWGWKERTIGMWMASVDGAGRPVGYEEVGGVEEEDSVPRVAGDGDTIIQGKVPRKERKVELCAGPELQTYQDAGKVGWGDVWEADGNTTVLSCRDSFQEAKASELEI